jgi:hypothetical protein
MNQINDFNWFNDFCKIVNIFLLILKIIGLLINCVWTLCNKILNAEFKGDKYFVDEVKSQLREKSLRGSQTSNIHYSEDKASYKAVALTYPWCSGRTLNSDVKPYTNASQPSLLPEGVFNGILYLRANP